ncbi:MAG: esterase, partial [Methylococcales bacterium]
LALDEGEADRSTVGHYEPLISHTLTPLDQEKNLPVADHRNMQNIWSNQSPGGATRFGSTVLTHLNKTDPRNPYLNIRVAKEIIADHNDVFGDQTMEFIRLLITLSTSD